MDRARRIAVITGANRGIGFEIARQLAGRDVHVVLTSRDQAKGLTAWETLDEEGLAVDYHQLDVTDPAGIRRLHAHLGREYGRLDILVNNAGVLLEGMRGGLQVDLDTARETMETNVYGPLILCQTLVPLMRPQGYGRIVNLSSGLGQLTDMGAGDFAYRMSKTALNVVTRVLAAELRGTNILVNSMCPGWVRTGMGGAGAPRSVQQGADTAVWLATLPDGGPTGGFFRDRERIPW